MSTVAAPNSDLGVRTLSAIVMLAVAGGALWIGGWTWVALMLLTACGVFWEWRRLVPTYADAPGFRWAWLVGGLLYLGIAAAYLIAIRVGGDGARGGTAAPLIVIGIVVSTDIGAYSAGRLIGGPKIWPKVSPSKTWAGLGGGIILATIWTAAAFVLLWLYAYVVPCLPTGCSFRLGLAHAIEVQFKPHLLPTYLMYGAGGAVVAQAGDFFESWMKRRAGVKDSGNLIPGHGGLFDRVDGLVAVSFVTGLILIFQIPDSLTRSITILGATGSVGASTLDLIRRNRDEWRVVALTANCQAVELAALAKEFGAELAVVADESCLAQLRDALAGSGIEAAAGAQALCEAASRPVDLTIAAIVGCAGLAPTMAAISEGGIVALANKEALVSAGEVMTAAVSRHGATLLPVDSEHNAIFQCLAGNYLGEVRWITLTASGGPFRDWTPAQLAAATPAQAVKHPNWDMGAKISIDSATMMNKGLELIEADHLFQVGLERIRIIVHPQSVVHSMVEFRDGSTLAQLGPSDMRVPIASTLAWPKRMDTPCAPLDLATIGQLTFQPPDEERFPATRIAREAAEAGGAAPAVLNAANEVAVAAFLAGQIAFTDISAKVEMMLSRTIPPPPTTLDEVLAVDAETRARATEMLEHV